MSTAHQVNRKARVYQPGPGRELVPLSFSRAPVIRANQLLPNVLGSSMVDAFADMFGGRRNFYQVLGYKKSLKFEDFVARYLRDSIAGRIVDIPAEETWSELPYITTDEKNLSKTLLSRQFDSFAKRVKLRRVCEKADRLAGIGEYSVILVGTADGQSLDEPLAKDSLRSLDDILYLSVFSQQSAIPVDTDLDPLSERFGGPAYYAVDLSRSISDHSGALASLRQQLQQQSFRTQGLPIKRVHASRIIHVADQTLEDDIYAVPRLQRVWNLLDDLAKAVGGSAEVFWMVANRGLQFDVDKEMELSAEDKADLERQFEEYQHDVRRMIRTRGVTIKGLNELGASIVNPKQVFGVVAALIVGTTGIPYRMLFGTERGQNITVNDRKAWLESTRKRQKNFGEEIILSPLISTLARAGALPKKAPEAEIVWAPIHDDLYNAQVAGAIAKAERDHAEARAKGANTITVGEFRSKYLHLPPEMEEDEPVKIPLDPNRPQPAPAGSTPKPTAKPSTARSVPVGDD